MLVAVAIAADSSAAASLEVVHQPVECVPSGRYAKVVATGAPAADVARAELQFRVRPDAPWYGVPMTADDGYWSAALPRPVSPLTHFEYRIVMTAPDLATVETAALPIRVVEDPARCAASSSIAVDAPIVVHVPAGAPIAPPVPPGFSPAGVMAAVEPVKKSSSTKKWLALTGIAGGVAAAAVAAGAAAQGEPTPTGIPSSFEFFGATPIPGSLLSLSRDRLAVTIRMNGGDRVFLDLLWRVDLLGGNDARACAMMFGQVGINAQRPQVLVLSTPLVPLGACGPSFEVASVRVNIMVDGDVVYDQIVDLPYRFEP